MLKIRLVIPVLFLGLFLCGLHGENLTTLDGKTFLGISDIAKYPNRIFFSVDGVRTNVFNTNIPDEFRIKHGIAVKTNALIGANKLTQLQLSPLELFLWNNRESELEQTASEDLLTNGDFNKGIYKCWTITLKSAEVTLDVFSDTSFRGTKIEDLRTTCLMSFDLEKDAQVSGVFDKFLEWENIATTNHAENFTKEIVRRPPNRVWMVNQRKMFGDDFQDFQGESVIYSFEWENNHATLNIQQPDPYTASFDEEDISHFKNLLKQLPALKEKLAGAIRSKSEQNELFK